MSDPATAAAIIGAATSVGSSLSGSKDVSAGNAINQDLLNQMAQQRKLGALIGQEGAVGNPFSGQYGPLFSQSGVLADPTGADASAVSEAERLANSPGPFQDAARKALHKKGTPGY